MVVSLHHLAALHSSVAVLAALAVVVLSPICVRLAAQEPSKPPADTTGADSARALPRVTVTGTRSPHRVLDVPLAVSVVGKEQLDQKRGYGLDEALNLVPGVLAQSRFGNQDVRVTIRVVGARGAGDRSNAGTSRGIRVLTDGIPETEPDGRTSFDFVDLAITERVDVIRSNASSLWGNAAGGVINLTTAPQFDASYASVEQMAGSFGLLRSVASAGTRLGEGRIYASFTNTSLDGWRDHSDSRRSLLTAGLLAPVGTRTLVGVQAMGTNNLFHIPGPLTRSQVDQDPRQANALYAGRNERRYNRLGRLGVTLEHRPSDRHQLTGMVFVNPKYLQRSERGTFRDFNRYHIGGNVVYRNFTPIATGVTSNLVIGADEAYQDGAILFYSLTPEGTRGAELRTNKREGANNFGVFVQEELEIGDLWAVTGGLRYDDITYYTQDYLTPNLDARKTFSRLTPKLGVVFRPTRTRSFYANVGGGVEAPAGNETDAAPPLDTVVGINPLLDPIRSTTYELGTKHIVAVGRFVQALSYDAALYYTDVRNEVVPYRGGRFYFTAGRARRMGAELGATVHATGGVTLATALTFSDNRYLDYVVDSVHYGRPGRFADFSDNDVVGVPSFFYGSSLTAAPAWARGLGLQLSLQGTSSYFADDANAVRVPAYAVANATLSFDRERVLGTGVGVRGFVAVNNLTDRRYIGSAFLNPDLLGGTPAAFEPGVPRHYVVAISLRRER
jgi:iron complex outermembrane receptor protein